MGWSSGSRLFDTVIQAISNEVSDVEARKRIYRPLIDSFEEMDWDTQDECQGLDPAYDELYNERYPDEEY